MQCSILGSLFRGEVICDYLCGIDSRVGLEFAKFSPARIVLRDKAHTDSQSRMDVLTTSTFPLAKECICVSSLPYTNTAAFLERLMYCGAKLVIVKLLDSYKRAANSDNRLALEAYLGLRISLGPARYPPYQSSFG